jgi:translation elongation factor EF-G
MPSGTRVSRVRRGAEEVIRDTLSAAFGIAVEFRETTTICIERPIGTGAAVEVMREAPNPFLATVGLRVDPAPPGSGVRFALEVELGSIRLAFHKAVEDTVTTTLQQGLHGWNVTDCVVTMTHSGYAPRQSHSHARFDKSMSSTGADFRHLTPLVLMNALRLAGTQVCEPVQQFRIEFPTDVLGAVSRALAQLDAIPLTTQTSDSTCTIEGEIPAARVHAIQQQLPSRRAAKAYSEFSFAGYRPVRACRRRALAPITIHSTAKRICWPSCAACRPEKTVIDGLAVERDAAVQDSASRRCVPCSSYSTPSDLRFAVHRAHLALSQRTRRHVSVGRLQSLGTGRHAT